MASEVWGEMAQGDTPAHPVPPAPAASAPPEASVARELQVIDDDHLPVPSRPHETGSTRAGRIARRVTGGPGTPVFEAAVRVREARLRVGARAIGWRGRMRRVRPSDRPGHVAVRMAGYPVLARVEPRATPLAEHHRLTAAIGAALARHSVDYFVIPGPANYFAIGVSSRQRDRVRAALRELGEAEDLLVSTVDPHRPTLAFRPMAEHPFGPDIAALSVWSPVVAADGRSDLGPHSRVTVQVWEAGKGGTLRAPTENRYAPYLLRSAQGDPVAIRVGSSHQPTFPELAETHIDDITFPVDLVYTWVDGSDERWDRRMVASRERLAMPVNESALDHSRFHSIDELKYSIRSAFAFAPWFRRIFLVTDDQVPQWLDDSDPRISVVSHREIWDDHSQLPVFNSHAIESRLHHIPGLSEHYVYLNDDVFFGRMTHAHAFFTSGGLSKFFPSPTRIGLGDRVLGEPPGSTAAKNDRQILREAVGAIQTQRLKHTAHPQRRSVAHELEESFPQVYRATAGATFRSPADISPIALQTWYGYRTGRAVPGSARYAYVGISSSDQLARLDELRTRMFTMFCLNQTEEQTVDRELMTAAIREFLQEYYPFESPLER